MPMHARVGVAQRSAAHHRRAVVEARGRCGTAGALRHVLVDLQVFVGMPVAEALHRGQNHLRVQFLDAFPAEAHAIERAGAEVLDHDVGRLDQLLKHLLAVGLLGVQRKGALVAIQHREIQGIDAGDVTQLVAGDVSRAGALHLDHVRTEPRKQLGASRTGLHVREVDNADSV
jgi:hypothetical protein